MPASLRDLLGQGRVLLADGATGTNYFAMGLESGEPPEFWISDHPDRVVALHQRFVDAGADIILTDTFGCNRHRLKLHRAEHRVAELASGAARLARSVADAAPRPVVVAGSVGPTGELFDPLGALTEAAAVEAFAEQIRALVDGGADVAWIETMSAPEEARAAAKAAIEVGVDYVCTMSFDTAGRTMMGLQPGALESVFADLRCSRSPSAQIAASAPATSSCRFWRWAPSPFRPCPRATAAFRASKARRSATPARPNSWPATPPWRPTPGPPSWAGAAARRPSTSRRCTRR